MKSLTLSLATVVFFLSACTSYRPIPAGTKAIMLSNQEERTSLFGVKVSLPAGDYLPDFSSEDGIYYLAPTSVTVSNLGLHTPMRGGLFVPSPSAKDQRQGAWSQQSAAATALGALVSGGSGGIHLYRFDDPIKFSPKK